MTYLSVADGLKSIVRRQIVGDVSTHLYRGWRYGASPFRPTGSPAICAGSGDVRIHGARWTRGMLLSSRWALLNFAGTVEADASEESWTLKFPWENLKADFAGWHPVIQAIIDAVDKDECYRWSLHNRPPIRNWSTRRATILGDAAHPTLPYLAQGAAMAIEDAAVLSRALSQAGSVEQAFDLYQRNRIDRTARVVEQSTENQKLFHLRSVAEIRRQFAHRDEGADRNKWLYSYNPLTVELTLNFSKRCSRRIGISANGECRVGRRLVLPDEGITIFGTI